MTIRKTALSFVILLGLGACTPPNSNRVPVERSLNDTPWGYQFVSSPVRAGEVSQRFEIRSGECGTDEHGSDCDRNAERSEVASDARWQLDDTVWISGSVYVPRGFQTNNGWTHIIQIKSSNPRGLSRNPQPFGLMLTRGRLRAMTSWIDENGEQKFKFVELGGVSQLEGRWTDFTIGTGPETGNRFVVYQDGREVVNEPNMYLDAQDLYLKYGIYRTAANFTNVLYWDEIRMGSTRAEVSINEDNPVD